MSAIQRTAATLSMLFVVGATAGAGEPEVNTGGNDIAIRGYDTVAYHTESKATKGKRRFSHEWKGARWLFSSAEHRDRFAADPGRYAPQYGGYGAWWVAQGEKKRIDPDAFTVHQGQLYLFYSAAYKEIWDRDAEGSIARAEERWLRMNDNETREG